jgi:hypothetical protein
VKKKPELEADLDPKGTRHTRPGAKAAERAVEDARSAATPVRRTGSSSPTRPGARAAARAVETAKPARKRRK